MSDRRELLQATAVISGATAASRVLGYVRDAVVAAYFGTGLYADAFIAAFRLPNVLRRLFGEGSLTISFIPIYTQVLHESDSGRAQQLFNRAFTLLSIVLVALTTLGIVFASAVVGVLAPGFGEDALKDQVTVYLTRVMLPYAVLICLVALFMGVLNAHKRFFAPAFAPVLLNVGMITCTVALGNRFQWPVTAVAVGVIVGGVLQVILQIPFLRKIGRVPRLNFHFRDRDLAKVGLLMLPGLIGLSVYTINVFINTVFASLLQPGAVSFLYYSDRLMELPQGIFAIAVGTALLPSLSSMAARDDRKGMVETMNYAMRLITLILLPASVGLYVLADPICNVLYQRGQFDLHSTLQTAVALRYYTLGLLFFGALRALVPTYYALKDSITPAIVALFTLLVNVGCGLSFMGPTASNEVAWISWITHHYNPTGPMAHGGLALANTFSALFNTTLLTVILRKRIGKIGGRRILRTFLISALACVPMAFAAHKVAGYFSFTTSGFGAIKTAGLVAAIVSGGATYAITLAALDRKQFADVLRRLRRKRPLNHESRPTEPPVL